MSEKLEEAPSPDSEKPTIYAWYVVFVLMLTNALSLLDRKLPFILVEPMKHDLHLSDTQVGLLTGVVFAAVYATMALPVASLADRFSRKWIITVAVVVWSGLTAAGGFARSFWHLAGARMGVAIGESAVSPSAHSMIAGYFPMLRRGRAMGLYFMGAQVGALSGLVIGGWLNDVADWRTAMILIGVPGLIFGALLALTVKEPPREPLTAAEPRPSVRLVAATLFRQRTFVHLFAAALLFMVTTAAVEAFTPAYIIRTFDLSTSKVGLYYGLTVGIGGMIGAPLGGYLSDRLRRGAPWRSLMMVSVAFLLTTPFMVMAYSTSHLGLCLMGIFLGQMATTMYAAPTFTTLQSLVPHRMHAVASAILLFALSGIGVSIGPLLAGALSDFFRAIGVENPLRWGLVIALLPKFWSAGHYFLAAMALRRRDREA